MIRIYKRLKALFKHECTYTRSNLLKSRLLASDVPVNELKFSNEPQIELLRCCKCGKLFT